MIEKSIIQSSAKKIISTLITQVIVLILSVVTGFILPQKMGPENFGYWQIYIFYLSYLNLFGLGFNDGFSLFYAGYDYDKLPYQKIKSSVKVFFIYLSIITLVLLFISTKFNGQIYKQIYGLLALSVPLSCIICFVLSVFLSVNKTNIYNFINLTNKVLSVTFYVTLLFFGISDSKNMMGADFISRLIITIICLILGRHFLFGKSDSFQEGIFELKEKSLSGIKLTISIIVSMLIPVIGRMVIEWNESIEIYGIYSFAMSLLAIIMAFTTTAGTVIFPILKKIDSEYLPGYYSKFVFVCDSLIYLALYAYIPLLIIVQNIMFKYVSSLDYLYILLAMCLPLGRMQLLITPYYKAFRMENSFLIINLIGLILMFAFTTISFVIFKSVIVVAICTTVILTLWTYGTEKYLKKKIGIESDFHIDIVQVIMMISFVISASFKRIDLFLIMYTFAMSMYFIINKTRFKNILNLLKSNFRTEKIK